MTPQFFHTPSDLRAWLEANHASSQELWLRLRKTTVPDPGVTYSEALDLALCFGWIDGVRHAVDGKSFAVRFTPRKPKSTWSKVNIRHYKRLERTGSVTAAGREAFQQRESSRTGRYSFESAPRELPPALERTFRANPAAWAFFMTRPPSYRRTATFWVLSAKKGETRERRLAQLILDSSHGQRLEMLRRPSSRKPALALAAIIGCCWLCAGQSIPPWFPAVPPLPPPRGEVIHVATAEELLAAVERLPAGGTIVLAGHLEGCFVDPASGSLALTSAATGALGQGVPLADVPEDICRRPRAECPNLGAWEPGNPAKASPAPASHL